MLQSWWDAHALEFVVTGVLLGACGVWWLVDSLSAIADERRKRKRDGLL